MYERNFHQRSGLPGKLLLGALICLLLGCEDAPPPAALMAVPDLPAPPADIVTNEADWETVVTGYVYSDAPAVDSRGDIYYAANTQNRIFHLDAADRINLFDDNTALTMGLMFGPDGRLYGCRNNDAQIVAYDMRGRREVLLQGKLTPLVNNPDAPGEFCNGLIINSKGQIWFTDRVNRRVMFLSEAGELRSVAEGFRPNGLALSVEEDILAVTDSLDPRLHAFQVAADGSLTEIPDFFAPVQMVDTIGNEESSRGRPGTNGMTIDSDGRFYVTSFYGIQIFDAQGQYVGVIKAPTGFTSNVTFGGSNLDVLYATGLKGVYRMPTKVRGAPYFLRARTQQASR